MATTATAFKTRFPEFTAVADARIDMFIADTVLVMGTEEERWIQYYDIAQEYYTAHLLVVGTVQANGDSSPIFPISHQEVDDVTIKQAVGDSVVTALDLYSTSYGKRYAEFLQRCFGGPIGV